MNQYLPILAMIILVILFAGLSFVASKLLGPRRPTSAKQAAYECGIVPEVEPVERFPVKFYLIAMAFIVLDVEIIFLYPLTTMRTDYSPPELFCLCCWFLSVISCLREHWPGVRCNKLWNALAGAFCALRAKLVATDSTPRQLRKQPKWVSNKYRIISSPAASKI